jgi:tetratricopeptide (TPR) repeat protein
VLVSKNMAARGTGQEITGAPAVEARNSNIQCLSQAQNGGLAAAVQCYDGVLQADPQNVEALAYANGLTGMSSAAGDIPTLCASWAGLANATALQPSYADAHAFLGVVHAKLGYYATAEKEFQKLDSLNPSPLISQQIDTFRTTVQARLADPAPKVSEVDLCTTVASGGSGPTATTTSVPAASATTLPAAGQ